MLKAQRYDKIIEFVNEKGMVTVEELAEKLKVSPSTIRRDLEYLSENRVLIRTHGGAVKDESPLTQEVPIYLRIHMQKEEKEQVATEAAKMISDHSTIYIGAGTTGRCLASKLHQFHHLTVVTNDVDVAKEVSATDNDLIVTGGQLKKSSSTLYGMFSVQVLQELSVDLAFMAVDAVDVEKGFMDFDIDEVSTKRLVIENAQHTVMMCDSSKFEKSAFVNVCPFSAVDAVITNGNTNMEKVKAIRETGFKVICAGEQAE